MNSPYRLVLFDLDGTLIDTIEDLAAAVNHALGLRGYPLHSLSEYRSMVGHGVRNLVMQALPPELQADEREIDAALSDFKAYYTAHIDVHTRPYPGMQELLRDLHAAGVRMAVASNKFQAGTEKLVREFFPEIPFVAILGNREGYPLKPDPEIVAEALRSAGLGVPGQAGGESSEADGDRASREAAMPGVPGRAGGGESSEADGDRASREDAVLVGDSGTDMQTARNGDIPAIAVGWGYRPMGPSEDHRYAGSVTELRTLLFDRPFFVGEPLNTPPQAFATPLQQAIYEAFARLGIPFTRVDTDPGITMEDCAHIDEAIGSRIVKTVFVCNRQQTEFYLYAMPSGKPFVTREFCAALGIPRVSFASEEKLQALTGVQAGATTVLSAILPSAAGVHVVIDRALAAEPWFACTDGTPTCFVRIATADLLDKYIPAAGHALRLI